MNIRLSAIDARIIGSLIEKQITTPDQYPLSLNALVNACNQKSNREPLMQLDEAGLLHDQVPPRETVDHEFHGGLIQLHQRLAVALLIACIDEGIERQRILIGRRDLLFDQRANDTGFDRGQFDIHMSKYTEV